MGLFRWATTPCSIFMGVDGLILIRLDRSQTLDASPLLDTSNFLEVLRHQATNFDTHWHPVGVLFFGL